MCDASDGSGVCAETLRLFLCILCHCLLVSLCLSCPLRSVRLCVTLVEGGSGRDLDLARSELGVSCQTQQRAAVPSSWAQALPFGVVVGSGISLLSSAPTSEHHQLLTMHRRSGSGCSGGFLRLRRDFECVGNFCQQQLCTYKLGALALVHEQTRCDCTNMT